MIELTKDDALRCAMYSHKAAKQTAQGLTEAFTQIDGRYIVRDQQGQTRATTSDPAYARIARLEFNGTIYDRTNYRNQGQNIC